MEVRLVQPSKLLSLMSVTALPRSTLTSDVQSLKTPLLILAAALSMLNVVSAPQRVKAESLISSKEAGRAIPVRLELSIKALFSIVLTVEGRVMVARLVQPSNIEEPTVSMPSPMIRCVNDVHPANNELPGFLLPGIEAVVRLVQPAKASLPKVVTLLGTTTEVKPVQSQKA